MNTPAPEKELIALRLWKEGALEAMEDHDRAYAAQSMMLREMHEVLNRVANALHDAQRCLSGYIEIKEEFITKINRTKRKNPK